MKNCDQRTSMKSLKCQVWVVAHKILPTKHTAANIQIIYWGEIVGEYGADWWLIIHNALVCIWAHGFQSQHFKVVVRSNPWLLWNHGAVGATFQSRTLTEWVSACDVTELAGEKDWRISGRVSLTSGTISSFLPQQTLLEPMIFSCLLLVFIRILQTEDFFQFSTSKHCSARKCIMLVLLCNSSPIIDLFTGPRHTALSALLFQNNNNNPNNNPNVEARPGSGWEHWGGWLKRNMCVCVCVDGLCIWRYLGTGNEKEWMFRSIKTKRYCFRIKLICL